VTLGFDNGYCVEATGGIAMDDDLLALNLGQSATEGERVQLVQQKNRLNFLASALVCTWPARLRVPQEPYPFAAMLVHR
jgi:hypothetical protein